MLTIGYAVIYNFGTNIFLGEISYLTKAIAAVLQLAVTMDYSIFLYHRYVEEKKKENSRNELWIGNSKYIHFLIFIFTCTTIAGFLVLDFNEINIRKKILDCNGLKEFESVCYVQ